MKKPIAQFNTLVVITPVDCERLLRLYPRLLDSISYGEICFVGSPEVNDVLNADKDIAGRVGFIDENSIIPFELVHAVVADRMKHILNGRELPRGVTGWYYQQFLKMQYAFVCEDEYYMIWDGDTIPCRKINMFQGQTGKPYLDLKHEFHREYFDTMGVILPGFTKVIERSFISEHMLFNAQYMRELVKDIENNNNILGSVFWEKILNAIPEESIQSSSFSEFETYGTYIALRHSDAYALREWHSFRLGGEFFRIDTISDRDFSWLSKDFDAISFEKGHFVREDHANLFDNPYYQEKLTPKQMLQAAQKEFKDGYKEIWDDDESSSVNESSGQFNKTDEESESVGENKELLKAIRSALERAPELIEQLPVEDIVSCVYVELYGLRQLYEEEHFKRLEHEFDQFCEDLVASKLNNDSVKAQETINKLIKFQDMLPDNEKATKFIEQANFDSEYIRHIKDNTLVVIGDSHVNFFSGNEKLSFIPIGNDVNTCARNNNEPITVLHFGPCLAYKSNQYGSTTRFREKLDWVLETFIQPDAKILCVLGEVDIRAHVFKQAEKRGEDYKIVINEILDNYMKFLIWLRNLGHEVICWGPVASQNDNCPISEEYPRVGTIEDRNRATIYFNEELNLRCVENSIGFISIYDDMISDDLQTKSVYLSEDHVHLGQYAYKDVIHALRDMGVI